MKKLLLQFIVIFVFIIFFHLSVHAFLPDQREKEEIYINPALCIKRSLNYRSGLRDERERQKMQRFRQDNGSSWRYTWNEWGTIHRLYGGKLNEKVARNTRGRSGSIEEQLVESAKQLITLYPEFFKISVDDLELRSVKKKAGIYYVDFDQYYQGIRVYGGGAQFRFNKEGDLLLIGGDTYSNIDVDINIRSSKNNASSKAYKDMGFDDIPSSKEYEAELVIVPWPVENGLGYIIAWQVFVSNSLPSGASLYFIDASSGEEIILFRKSLLRKAAKGRITGQILPEYYNDTPQEVPFSNENLYLLIDTNTPVYKETLDQDPQWKTQGLWEFGDPVPQGINSIYGHAGCPDPNSGHTGANVYGYNLTGDYTNLMRPTYLTSPSISCQINLNSADCLVLTFWRWLGVYRAYWESDSGSREDYDRAELNISDDDGFTWTSIWSNDTRQIEDGQYNSSTHLWEGWKFQFFDISEVMGLASDPNIILRWGIGSTNDSGTFCGWNIDDIAFYQAQKDQTDPNGRYLFEDSNSESMLVGKLKGKYAEVINEDGASALFHYELSDPNFTQDVAWNTDKSTLDTLDEFNAYYHVNKILAYVKAVEKAEGENYDYMDKKKPIKIIVRYGDNYDNAFWSPDHVMAFGEGNSQEDGYRNFSHFSDVIYHEYTHAITDSFYSYLMPPLTSMMKDPSRESTPTDDSTSTQPVFVTEFDAMHEAFSDYWAATVNGDSMIGDGDFWVGHTYLRDVSNDFKIPDDYGDDAYANSLILSGAMWEVREFLGAEIANKLFHFARYGGASEFNDYLIDVLMQDRILYEDPNDPESSHVELITEIFGNRGISQAPSTPTGLVAVAGNTIINLQWRENPDIDAVAGYYVYFRTENDIVTSQSDPSVQRDAGVTTEYTLEGLTNGTTYVIYLKAYNKYDTKSNESDYVYATPFQQSDQTPSNTTQKTSLCFISHLM
ncbi:MAG: fibronectin type III domain-containing protein [bacterium]